MSIGNVIFSPLGCAGKTFQCKPRLGTKWETRGVRRNRRAQDNAERLPISQTHSAAHGKLCKGDWVYSGFNRATLGHCNPFFTLTEEPTMSKRAGDAVGMWCDSTWHQVGSAGPEGGGRTLQSHGRLTVPRASLRGDSRDPREAAFLKLARPGCNFSGTPRGAEPQPAPRGS